MTYVRSKCHIRVGVGGLLSIGFLEMWWNGSKSGKRSWDGLPVKEKRSKVLRRSKVDIRIHIIIISERLKKILYPREIHTDMWKLKIIIK